MKNLTEKEISLISRIIEKKELEQEELTTAIELLLSNLSNEDYDAILDILADSENEDSQTTLKKMLLNLINRNSKDGPLIFHATMSVAQFIESGYAAKGTLDVIENPKGNTHPANLFISWKDKEGTPYSGAVSNNIASIEEITDPVLSIVSKPDSKDMFILLHNKHDAPADNTKMNLA